MIFLAWRFIIVWLVNMENMEILEKEKEPKIISLGFGPIWTAWAELFLPLRHRQSRSYPSKVG